MSAGSYTNETIGIASFIWPKKKSHQRFALQIFFESHWNVFSLKKCPSILFFQELKELHIFLTYQEPVTQTEVKPNVFVLMSSSSMNFYRSLFFFKNDHKKNIITTFCLQIYFALWKDRSMKPDSPCVYNFIFVINTTKSFS